MFILKISIHAPHTGCDTYPPLHGTKNNKFQSTHPTRGATCQAVWVGVDCLNFNPRTPHGVRPLAVGIRARVIIFQSTHPTRGATVIPQLYIRRPLYFNPRTPHGVRLRDGKTLPAAAQFQSTHPTRGATTTHLPVPNRRLVFQSTHPTRGATAKTRKLMQKTSSQSITMHLM